MDAGRAYIPENNAPIGFGISEDRRVFVSIPRCRTGIYSNLGYFRLDDIGQDEECPPLTPYPPTTNVTLNADCCTNGNIVNINRIFIDESNRLWGLDRQSLRTNDIPWNLASPRLLVFDLKTDYLVREAVLPSELYGNGEYQLGLVSLVVTVDEKDSNNAFAYIVDSHFGCIIVYSYAQNKFWKHCTPQFYSDAKYSKFHLTTHKNKNITYYKQNFIVSCTRDFKNQQLICHSDCQLDEYTIPFAQLNSEEVARCSPNSLNVHFLGQKNRNGQSSVHTMNKKNQVVYTVQEQNYGIACWNRENPLHPEAVKIVVSDRHKLPYITDVERTDADLKPFLDYHSHVHPKNYVVAFSNNYKSIIEHGFDHHYENFGFYFFVEEEATHAHPECLYKDHHYKQTPHYPASKYSVPQYPTPKLPASQYPAPNYPSPPQYSHKPTPYQSYQPRPYSPTHPHTANYRYKKSDESNAEETKA